MAGSARPFEFFLTKPDGQVVLRGPLWWCELMAPLLAMFRGTLLLIDEDGRQVRGYGSGP